LLVRRQPLGVEHERAVEQLHARAELTRLVEQPLEARPAIRSSISASMSAVSAVVLPAPGGPVITTANTRSRAYPQHVTARTRNASFGAAAVLIVAGILCAALLDGTTAGVVAIALIGVGGVLAVALVFLAVGLSEDRERAAEEERRRSGR
jgi:hypothetical protein